jgi:hypothetical protein
MFQTRDQLERQEKSYPEGGQIQFSVWFLDDDLIQVIRMPQPPSPPSHVMFFEEYHAVVQRGARL